MNRLTFSVRLLLSRDLGGTTRPLENGARARWNLGNTWLGESTVDEARVVLESAIQPGVEASAHLEPLEPECWSAVRVGSVISLQERNRLTGYATVIEVVRPEHFTSQVLAFVAQARQFCEFIEKADSLSLAARLSAARERLLELYRAGTALPLIAPPEDFSERPSPVLPKPWAGFGEHQYYWEVRDPYVDEPPGLGDLSDDVIDVYLDLRRGLELWHLHEAQAAIWTWRFHFDIHWGDHASDALRALHRACRNATTGSS